MLSTPHRKFCEAIVSGLTGVRAYSQAYPSCSLNSARINASQLRAKPHIQQEIARLRAQANAIAGPAVLTLLEKRVWLARVVRAHLADLDPQIDSDLLVSLHVEKDDKKRQVRKIRIFNKLTAIRLDSRLAGDEPAKSKPSKPTLAEELLADGGLIAPNGLIVPFEHCGWKLVPPPAPTASPDIPPQAPASPFDPRPSSFEPPIEPRPSSFRPSADSPATPAPVSSDELPITSHASPLTASPDALPAAPASTFGRRPSTSDLSPSSPASSAEPPIDNGYIAPVFTSRPRFYPGPDFAARERARRNPVRRHAWDEC